MTLKETKKKANFWSGGITDRSFIMLISVFSFFSFAIVGMVTSLFMDISKTYMDILQMTVPPLMTIIVSVFGIEGVEKITDRKTKEEIGNIVEKKLVNAEDIDEVTYQVSEDIKEEDSIKRKKR